MSDSEEDYMSNKVLIKCEKEDVRPGLLFSKRQKRQHELYKKKQENLFKKPKTYNEQEKETREEGLNTAISSENKGFQMLEKMGYKVGMTLGKSIVGITEPLKINVKSEASGVGQDTHMQEIIQKKQEKKDESFKAKVNEFKSANVKKYQLKTLQKDYKRAQKACEELDLKFGKTIPAQEYFWARETVDTLNKRKELNAQPESEGEESEGEKSEGNQEKDMDEEEEEEEEEDISEPKLCDIIIYLRREYSYCIYCGDYVKYPNSEVLCPGLFRQDHDE